MEPSHATTKAGPAGLAYALALAGGATLWLVTMAISGRNEAWDAPLYWQAAYPLAIVLSAGLGYLAPERPWRWGLSVMWVQALVMIVTSGSSFGLLPLGLILFGVLAVPPIVAAQFVARLRRRAGA